MVKRFVFFVIIVFQGLSLSAQEETPNARQARRIMNTAFERVFGPQGSTLRYDVNIIGIYKTKGVIWFKEKKQRFSDERVDTWNNGTTAYMAYRKKKTIEIHDANSDKKDKYSGRFKFSLDDFTYSVAKDPEGLLLTMKQKKKAKGTIKEVRALVAERTYAPIRLRIKVAFIWTTIHISDFQSGNISDDIFEFPREKFDKKWKYVDKRKD
jgi:hypothetical protein